MLVRSRSVTPSATALAVGMILSVSGMAAQAPTRGAHHFSLKDQTPTQTGPSDPQKPTPVSDSWKLALSGEQTEGFITVQDEMWNPDFKVPLHFHKKHSDT